MSNAKQGHQIRLHKYVTKQTGLNKTQAIELILAGKVKVDGLVCLDSKAQVSSKAMLQVELPPLNKLIKGFDLVPSNLNQLPIDPSASQPSYQVVPAPMGVQANPNYVQSIQNIIAAARAAGAASAIAAAFPFLANAEIGATAAGTQGDAAAPEQGKQLHQDECENIGLANINQAVSSFAAANEVPDDKAEVSRCTDLVEAPNLTPVPAQSSFKEVVSARPSYFSIPATSAYWHEFDSVPDYDCYDTADDYNCYDDCEYDAPYREERYQENYEEVLAGMSMEERDIFSVEEYADLMGYDLYN